MTTVLNFRQSATMLLFSRFFYSYVVLYCLSNQFVTSSVFNKFWAMVAPVFNRLIMRANATVQPTLSGSGDSFFDYTSVLMYATVAIGLAAVWSLFARSYKSLDGKLQTWIWILLRYYIFWQMMLYGFAKVLYLQFQPPSVMRLLQPLGESSPMGLLWTFMGYSEGYTVFTGMGEVVGGLLLLFRRTVSVGALVVFGVMVNVMMLNFCYDVPVKLLSTHLVLFSLFLLYLDRERIWAFVNNRVVVPVVYPSVFKNPRLERIKKGAKWLVVILAIGVMLLRTVIRDTVFDNLQRKSQFPDYYQVQLFERNGQEVAPLITDSTRWHYLAIEHQRRAQIRMTDGSGAYYKLELDSARQEMQLAHPDRSWENYRLQFEQGETGLTLEGTSGNGDSLRIVLALRKKEDFPLLSQRFRWVQERPDNR